MGRDHTKVRGVRSPPPDLEPELLTQVLAECWRLRAASLTYVPEGGGSHHWKLTGPDGSFFVTVDDLDHKDWLGDTRTAVLDGLRRALATVAALRHEAGLEFAVAPIADHAGGFVGRVDDRYAVSVFPFLTGRSYSFGPYTDAGLRGRVLDMIAALHRATAAVRSRAPRHSLSFSGRPDLDAFLLDPGRPWSGGPYAEPARRELAARAADLARLTAAFDRVAVGTLPASADLVITHGEPHPANLMSVGSRLMLIDWDTIALAQPERDLALIASGPGDLTRYREAAGREPDLAVIGLYRLRWYLDDLASAVRLFRNPHRDTADTRRWHDGLAPVLSQLPGWLERLASS
jgi:spectinomycin phosphotransferase